MKFKFNFTFHSGCEYLLCVEPRELLKSCTLLSRFCMWTVQAWRVDAFSSLEFYFYLLSSKEKRAVATAMPVFNFGRKLRLDCYS